MWDAATEASVTGLNRSRSYWHSTEAVLPASAARDAFLELRELLDPGHRPQRPAHVHRDPQTGYPSLLEDAICRFSHPIAASR